LAETLKEKKDLSMCSLCRKSRPSNKKKNKKRKKKKEEASGSRLVERSPPLRFE